MKTLYMIGGTMGVGKTAVCQVLKRKLRNSVFLDGDWCWNSDPFQVTEETKAMVLDNISHLLSNFIKCSAYDNIIFCWVMHEQSIIDSIMEKLDTFKCNVKNISLVCSENELRSRLAEDIAKELRSSDIIERSTARIGNYSHLNTIKLDTTFKTIQQVAEEIERL